MTNPPERDLIRTPLLDCSLYMYIAKLENNGTIRVPNGHLQLNTRFSSKGTMFSIH